MSDDGYSNSRDSHGREYNNNYKSQYTERSGKSNKLGYAGAQGYNDGNGDYKEEQRNNYSSRDSGVYYDENKSNYTDEYNLRNNSRSDYYRKPSEYYGKNENSYSKVSEFDYPSKNGFAYDEYQKKQRPDNRSFCNEQEPFYSKDPSYSARPYKTKHVPAEPNSTIGVFGFNPSTTEDDLKNCLLDKLQGISGYTYKLILDERTGLCKGYCFINFKCLDDAITAKHLLNTQSFRGQDFKCDYSYKQGILGEN